MVPTDSVTPGSGPDEGLVAINWSAYERSDGWPRHPIGSGSFTARPICMNSAMVLAEAPPRPGDGQATALSWPEPTFDIYRDSGLYGQNAQPWTQLTYVDKGPAWSCAHDDRSLWLPADPRGPGYRGIAVAVWRESRCSTWRRCYRLPTTNAEGTGWQSIWDAGGRDRIDGARARAARRSAQRDLR